MDLVQKIPPKLVPFFIERSRYKIVWGGRGSGKTVTIAQILLLLAYAYKELRILCTREIQKTIRESVHQVLADEVKRLELDEFFQVKNDSIIGLNGSEFIFSGLRAMDVAKLKSLHGVHIAWAEEAQVISDKSWEVLIPTIRAEHEDFGASEIWASLNPELDTDPTYTRFIEHPPPNSLVVKVNHSDNPFFPQVLETERQYLLDTDKSHGKSKYRHIWEGECLPAIEGAIFANEVARLFEDGRVRPLDYDPKGLVYGVWDLGWGVSSVILVQRFASTVQIIGYIERRHATYHDITLELRKLDYRWGKMFMPHDATHKDPKYGKSHFDVMKELGWQTEQIPNIGVENYIGLGRDMFANLYISDREECKGLIHCLRRFKRSIPATTDHPGAPMKDEFSHGSEAYCYTAVVADRIVNDDVVIENPYRGFESGYAA